MKLFANSLEGEFGTDGEGDCHLRVVEGRWSDGNGGWGIEDRGRAIWRYIRLDR
jgi:hypothetical protein